MLENIELVQLYVVEKEGGRKGKLKQVQYKNEKTEIDV
jgi:hypothetical protein